MSGPVALHGGGEFLPGDEPFLLALLEAGRLAAGADGAETVRVVIVPAAAARHRPELAARHGVEAFEWVAAAAGIPATAEAALVVDAASAADPAVVALLAAAHVVHLPGGDPDLVPGTLRGTAAWDAILDAHRRGAIVAGASAGAMGLATACWTPSGFREGLGLVDGILIVPHFEQFDPRGREDDIDRVGRDRLTPVGLDERTGVIREARGRWRVVGEGTARWLPPGGDPVVGRHGDVLPIDA